MHHAFRFLASGFLVALFCLTISVGVNAQTTGSLSGK